MAIATDINLEDAIAEGLAAALAILAESQERDDTFYVSLKLSTRLDAFSERCDHGLQIAKPIFDKEV